MVRLNRTPPAPNEQNKLRCNPQNITAAETRNGSLESSHGLFIPRNDDGSYSSLYHGESTSAIHVVKTMHACTKFTATLSSVLLHKILSKGVFSPFEYSQEVLALPRADPDQQELPETRDPNSLYIEMDIGLLEPPCTKRRRRIQGDGRRADDSRRCARSFECVPMA